MKRYFDVVFFDCDSTLISIESLDMLGDRLGVGREVRRMTTASMNGKEPFTSLFQRKIDLMRPGREDVRTVADMCRASLVPGALEVVARLREAGTDVYIISSNFYDVVNGVAEALGIPTDHVRANTLLFDANGQYAGIAAPAPLMDEGGKAVVVRSMIRKGQRSVFVGDGMTDAETADVVDCFIGFGGVAYRERVRGKSDVYITEPTLLSLLPHVLPGVVLSALSAVI